MITGELLIVTEENVKTLEEDLRGLRECSEEYKRLLASNETGDGKIDLLTCVLDNERYAANLFVPQDVDDLAIVLDMKLVEFGAKKMLAARAERKAG